jgi:RNA polymerase sigma-70 factor, ECF subfamily
MTPTPADFVRMYRRHGQSLLVFFQRRLGDAEASIDLVAETFAVAIERADDYDGEHDSDLSAWLWEIGRSLLAESELRGRVERTQIERMGFRRRALHAEEVKRLDWLAEQDLDGDAAQRALARLPEEQREAVRLRMLEELDYAEVARRLGLKESTARNRVARGLTALRRLIHREEQA